jgi:hypothetical protein
MTSKKHEKSLLLLKELQQRIETTELSIIPENFTNALNIGFHFIEKQIVLFEIITARPCKTETAEILSQFLTGRIISGLINALSDTTVSKVIEENEYSIQVTTFGTSVSPIERLTPFFTFIYFDEFIDEKKDQFCIELNRIIRKNPFILFITSGGTEIEKEFMYEVGQNALFVDVVNLEDSENSFFNSKYNPAFNHQMRNLLSEYIITSQIEHICTFYELYIKQDISEISIKRMTIAQQITLLQQQLTGRRTHSDILSQVKHLVQNDFGEFEKEIKESADEKFRNKIGSLWLKSQELINKLQSLKAEKKTKKQILFVSNEFQEELVDFIYKELYNYCSGDIKKMNAMLDSLKEKTKGLLKEETPDVEQFFFKQLYDTHFKKTLESIVHIERPYKSEVKRLGGYEIFMAIRRYQMIFFMMFSTFGLTAIFQKTRWIMLSASLILLSIGIFSVLKSSKKEKIETELKELEKAKESLLHEIRRMFSEIQREWSTIITNHLREQMQSYILHLEKLIKDTQSKKTTELNQTKQILTKQLTGIDVKEKMLSNELEANKKIWQQSLLYIKESKNSIIDQRKKIQ